MTPPELTAWRSRMGWTAKKAAEALGLSQHGYAAYESGFVRRRDAYDWRVLKEIPRPIPKHVALACQKLEEDEWSQILARVNEQSGETR